MNIHIYEFNYGFDRIEKWNKYCKIACKGRDKLMGKPPPSLGIKDASSAKVKAVNAEMPAPTYFNIQRIE